MSLGSKMANLEDKLDSGNETLLHKAVRKAREYLASLNRD